MKKIALFILLFNIVIALSAETVFVYIEKGQINLGKGIDDDSIEWINSMEKGVMDIFFESGHIIFSDNSGKNQYNSFKVLDQTAKASGANYLIYANLNFQVDKNNNITPWGNYKIHNLKNDVIAHDGEYKIENAFKSNSKTIYEQLFEMGETVGKEVVNVLF